MLPLLTFQQKVSKRGSLLFTHLYRVYSRNSDMARDSASFLGEINKFAIQLLHACAFEVFVK
jgi:hypothetical protein